jgi:hypothetical protein
VGGKVEVPSSDWGRWFFGVEKDLVGRRRVRGSDDDEGKEGRDGVEIEALPSQLPPPEPELEAEEPDLFLSWGVDEGGTSGGAETGLGVELRFMVLWYFLMAADFGLGKEGRLLFRSPAGECTVVTVEGGSKSSRGVTGRGMLWDEAVDGLRTTEFSSSLIGRSGMRKDREDDALADR